MTDREIFQENLTNLMRKSKVKQVDVAEYAEVSYKTVSAWVHGRGYPRIDAMTKLCKFFGVKMSALTGKEEMPDEQKLLMNYRALPSVAKKKLIERSAELLKLYGKG